MNVQLCMMYSSGRTPLPAGNPSISLSTRPQPACQNPEGKGSQREEPFPSQRERVLTCSLWEQVPKTTGLTRTTIGAFAERALANLREARIAPCGPPVRTPRVPLPSATFSQPSRSGPVFVHGNIRTPFWRKGQNKVPVQTLFLLEAVCMYQKQRRRGFQPSQ